MGHGYSVHGLPVSASMVQTHSRVLNTQLWVWTRLQMFGTDYTRVRAIHGR